MTETRQLAITFQSEVATEVSISYSMELDSDYFETVNGAEKSTFALTDTVFLKVFPPFDSESYTLSTSSGSLVTATKNILYEVTETLQFTNSNTASLRWLPYGSLIYNWIGTTYGSVTNIGKTVSAGSTITALLNVTYQTRGDRLQLTGVTSDGVTTEEFDVLCVAQYTGNAASELVNFNSTYFGEAVYEDVILTIKDVITDLPVGGASVSVTGPGVNFTGNTDSAGRVTIPSAQKGSTYSLSIQALGYVNSGVDYLNNDSFTVPEDE